MGLHCGRRDLVGQIAALGDKFGLGKGLVRDLRRPGDTPFRCYGAGDPESNRRPHSVGWLASIAPGSNQAGSSS